MPQLIAERLGLSGVRFLILLRLRLRRVERRSLKEKYWRLPR
jgi:hypothetical protein